MIKDKKRIIKEANKLRDKYHMGAPPIDVFKIAKNEDIEVRYFEPNEYYSNTSAILDMRSHIVYLNSKDKPGRQAFSLSHELAHYFLGHKANDVGIYERGAIYVEDKSKTEKEADIFAAELLMPKKVLGNYIKKYNLDTNSSADIELLSKVFGVTKSAIDFQIKHMT